METLNDEPMEGVIRMARRLKYLTDTVPEIYDGEARREKSLTGNDKDHTGSEGSRSAHIHLNNTEVRPTEAGRVKYLTDREENIATDITILCRNGPESMECMADVRYNYKYIGQTDTTTKPVTGDLNSDIQRVLRDLNGAIGNRQVTMSRLQSVPSWIKHKYLLEENDRHWSQADHEVDEA